MSFGDYAFAKGEVRLIVKKALNSGRSDAERDALLELAEMTGLEYNDDEGRYE